MLANRNALVMNHLGLVYWAAKRFRNRGVELDDLVQTGSLGLVEAATRFDPAKNVKFSAYAARVVIGKLLDELNNRLFINMRRRQLRAGLRAPVVCGLLGNESELARYEVSAEFESEQYEQLARSLAKLPRREREILLQRSAGETLEQIGKKIKLTRQRVFQIVGNSLQALRADFYRSA